MAGHYEFGDDSGIRIQGLELWVNAGGRQVAAYLRTPGRIAGPYGECRGYRHATAWRDEAGTLRVTLGPAHPDHPSLRIAPTASEAATIEAATARPSAGAGPREAVPGIAEIAAACEVEGTSLAPAGRADRDGRRCVECGSMVYGEYCTHCMEG